MDIFSDREVGFFKFLEVLLSTQIIDRPRISDPQDQNNRTRILFIMGVGLKNRALFGRAYKTYRGVGFYVTDEPR